MIIDKMRAMDGKWFDGRYVVRDMSGRVLADNFKTKTQAQEWIDLSADASSEARAVRPDRA